MKKISIIVPIYKVEAYLEKCVNSIRNQTYRNLEIILVDDGSPDKCPYMCDEFAKQDNRIKVIHKKNGGLSEARNVGIESASGEYLLFVDSDDWIEKTMVEHLLETCETFGVKLACCARYLTDGSNIEKECFLSKQKVYSCEAALKEILLGRAMDVAAWDKIYSKELFEDIRYPEGENNEDMAVFYKIIEKAGKVAHCGTTEYYYRSRAGSITKMSYNVKARKTIIKNLSAIETYLRQKYPDCMEAFERYKVVNIYYLLNKYMKCIGISKSKEYLYLLGELKKQKAIFFNDPEMPQKEKIIAFMILTHVYNPYLRLKKIIIGYK